LEDVSDVLNRWVVAERGRLAMFTLSTFLNSPVDLYQKEFNNLFYVEKKNYCISSDKLK